MKIVYFDVSFLKQFGLKTFLMLSTQSGASCNDCLFNVCNTSVPESKMLSCLCVDAKAPYSIHSSGISYYYSPFGNVHICSVPWYRNQICHAKCFTSLYWECRNLHTECVKWKFSWRADKSWQRWIIVIQLARKQSVYYMYHIMVHE